MVVLPLDADEPLPELGLGLFAGDAVPLGADRLQFEPAAVRWLARLALEESDVGLADVQLAAAALRCLRGRRPAEVEQTFTAAFGKSGALWSTDRAQWTPALRRATSGLFPRRPERRFLPPAAPGLIAS